MLLPPFLLPRKMCKKVVRVEPSPARFHSNVLEYVNYIVIFIRDFFSCQYFLEKGSREKIVLVYFDFLSVL